MHVLMTMAETFVFVQKIISKSGWIQGLAKGEGVASEAESCQCSQAEWCE